MRLPSRTPHAQNEQQLEVGSPMNRVNSKTTRVSGLMTLFFVTGIQGLAANSSAAQSQVPLQPFAQQVR